MVHVCVIAHVHACAHERPTHPEKNTYSPRSQAPANNGDKINPREIMSFNLLFPELQRHASMLQFIHASHS